MNSSFVIEADFACKAKAGESICGDAILLSRVKDENRLIAVLSDGLGSGVQANVSATMTSTMALQFTKNGEAVERTAEFITNTLPIDQKRKVSYATFTIVDVNYSGEVKVIEYDNPTVLLFRNNKFVELEKKEVKVNQILATDRNTLYQYQFTLEKEDRVIVISDGVTQSGMGTDELHFGWQINGLKQYISEEVKAKPQISAQLLAKKL